MNLGSQEFENNLIARLKQEQTRDVAFKELMRVYQEPLYWHVRRMVGSHDDADDVLQSTFIKGWKFIEGFRGDSKLKTWLYRIATNEALTHLSKREKYAIRVSQNHLEDELGYHGMELMDGEQLQKKLSDAVDGLPAKQKQVFVMRYYDELTYEEIVDVLGGTVGSLKASYHHAVKKIEQRILMD